MSRRGMLGTDEAEEIVEHSASPLTLYLGAPVPVGETPQTARFRAVFSTAGRPLRGVFRALFDDLG
jgi:hypothetical protein